MKLTDRSLASGATLNDLIHIVITSDTSQNSAGSSYKIPMGAYASLFGGGGDTYWTSGSTWNGANYPIKANNDSGLDATGDYAVAEGYKTLASGYTSHAEGQETTAGASGGHAEGYATIAAGEVMFPPTSSAGSHAEGWGSVTGDVPQGFIPDFVGVAAGAPVYKLNLLMKL